MGLTRRDFIRASALAAAFACIGAGGYLATRKEEIAKVLPIRTKDFPVGQCRFCAVGCTTIAEAEVDEAGNIIKVIAIKGDPTSPVNRGVLCTKGFYLNKALAYEKRPKKPLIRKEWINPATGKPDLRNSPRVTQGITTKDPEGLKPSEVDLQENFVEVDWETILDFIADAMEMCIKEYGIFSIGYYGSGQLGTEETYVMNKALKGGLPNNHIEGQPRMCMASAVVAYLQTFGRDEPYGSFDDIDVPDPDYGVHADTFFIMGNNTAEAHPVLFNRIATLKYKNPEKIKIILADPRKTRSGTIADLWLPFMSGSNLSLLNAMLHHIVLEANGIKRVVDVENAKVELENGKIVHLKDIDWKYVDIKFIKRHCNFGIVTQVQKVWVLNQYGGTRGEVWDPAYKLGTKAKFFPDPRNADKYKSEEEIEKDWWKGFAMYIKFLEDYKPDKVVDIVFRGEIPLKYDRSKGEWVEIDPAEAIRLAAKWFAEGYTVSLWCMGVNQNVQGVWINRALHALHLITGKAVKPGRHAFSLTGQPNACGGIRAPGALCHALPYGRVVFDGVNRKEVESIWKKNLANYLRKKGYSESEIQKEIEKIKIHGKPGPHTIEMFRRYGAGQIKIMFISTVNPGQSLPYAYVYRKAMAGAEKGKPWPLTITLEAFPTTTTMVSDIVLPAASWYEKSFTYGNTERRYQYIRKIMDPPSKEMLPDSVIFAMIWRKMEERGIIPKGFISMFWPEDYGEDWVEKTIENCHRPEWIDKFTENLWNELRELSNETPYDLSGITRDKLKKKVSGYRMPMPEEYDTDPDVKARYDKYQSRITYAYPYDPHIEKHTRKALENLKKWAPLYAKWVEKNIEETKNDLEYKKKEKLPSNYWISFYASCKPVYKRKQLPDGTKVPIIDCRAIIWSNPHWATYWDEKEQKFKIFKKVRIIKKKFNPQKAYQGLSAGPLPFDKIEEFEADVIGDPEKDLNSLFTLVLSPPEIPGVKVAYKKPDGSEIVIIDASEYPYGLCTGRVIEHWHTATMTNRVPEINRVLPEAYVEINAKLAEKLGIKDGDPVILESPRAKIELKAKVLDPKKALGGPRYDYLFVPWFDEKKLIGFLLRDNFDPFSFQADYKMAAVKLYKGTLQRKQAIAKPVTVA